MRPLKMSCSTVLIAEIKSKLKRSLLNYNCIKLGFKKIVIPITCI